jgi:xylose isomerase
MSPNFPIASVCFEGAKSRDPVAAALPADGRIAGFVQERYSAWDSDLGRKIEAGKASLAELCTIAFSNLEPALQSGRQEMLESIVNQVLFN